MVENRIDPEPVLSGDLCERLQRHNFRLDAQSTEILNSDNFYIPNETASIQVSIQKC